MAEKITIPIIRDTAYQLGDRVEIEIDGQAQPDRIYLWLSETTRDAVVAGATVGPLLHQTLGRFPAGDYDLRLRGIDQPGNVGDWSTTVIIEHRPTPPPPTDLAIAGDNLTGNWSDN